MNVWYEYFTKQNYGIIQNDQIDTAKGNYFVRYTFKIDQKVFQ